MLRRLPFTIFVILLLGLALGGCGDGGDEAGTTHPVVVSSSQPAARVSPTALPPPATQTPISPDAAPTSAETATQAAIAPTLATVSTGTTTTMAATATETATAASVATATMAAAPSPLFAEFYTNVDAAPHRYPATHTNLYRQPLHLAPPAARAAIRLLSGWDCSWLPAAWKDQSASPTPGMGAAASSSWSRWAASASSGMGCWLARHTSISPIGWGPQPTSRASWVWLFILPMLTMGPFL